MLRRANFLSDSYRYDDGDPDGFHAGLVNATKATGAKALAVKVMELPSAQSVCPYHYEYEEEWLVVLEGSVVVRTPEGEETLERGEIVHFPAGASGAHKVSNRDASTARIIMFSSAHEPSVAVYPDSDKIGVWTGSAEDHVMLRREDGAVDYYDGERDTSS